MSTITMQYFFFLVIYEFIYSCYLGTNLSIIEAQKSRINRDRPSLMAQMVKNLPAMQETWVRAWVGKISWRRAWQPTLVFLPGKFHGQRSLAGYIPWGLQRVGNDWATNTHTQTHTHIILATTMRRYYKGYSEVQGMTIMSIWAEVFSVAKIS